VWGPVALASSVGDGALSASSGVRGLAASGGVWCSGGGWVAGCGRFWSGGDGVRQRGAGADHFGGL